MRNVINVCSCCNLRHAPMLIGLSYHSWPPLGLPRKTQEVHEGNKKRNPGHERIQSNMTHMILIWYSYVKYAKYVKSRRLQRLSDAERSKEMCGLWFHRCKGDLRIHGFKVRPEDPSHVGLLHSEGDMGHHEPTKSKAAVLEQSRT